MPHQAQPTISFASRVPAEVDRRRRRLQAQIRCTMPELFSVALQALERSLNSGPNVSEPVATQRANSEARAEG